jgi:drug/metabolite transporter (DMT)-like permease
MKWFTVWWVLAVLFAVLSVALTALCFYQRSTWSGVASLLNTCSFIVTLIIFWRWSR